MERPLLFYFFLLCFQIPRYKFQFMCVRVAFRSSVYNKITEMCVKLCVNGLNFINIFSMYSYHQHIMCEVAERTTASDAYIIDLLPHCHFAQRLCDTSLYASQFMFLQQNQFLISVLMDGGEILQFRILNLCFSMHWIMYICKSCLFVIFILKYFYYNTIYQCAIVMRVILRTSIFIFFLFSFFFSQIINYVILIFIHFIPLNTHCK